MSIRFRPAPRRWLRLALPVVLLLAAALQAKPPDGIHLPSGGEVNWMWTLSDPSGMRWDFDSNGRVSDGQNDAYDGGMRLLVNDSDFQWSEAGRLGGEGREVEIGPWSAAGVQVSRRIYIDGKIGYCRWIDIFENTSGGSQTVRLRWMTSHGGSNKQVAGVASNAMPGEKDWAFAVFNPSDSRPGVLHFLGDRASRVRPSVQFDNGNRQVNYSLDLTVPAGKASAVCIIHAQRSAGSSVAEMKKFKLEEELQKIPQALRRILVNVGGGGIVSVGDIDLPRRENGDLVVLRNDNELLGTLLNSDYQVETSFGMLTLPAERVMGLTSALIEQHVQVVLTDAQVVVGRLVNQPLRIRLSNGNEMKLPTHEIRTAAYRLASSRPKNLTASGSFVVLRRGSRLLFSPEAADCTFQSECGKLKLTPQTLQAIDLDTPDNGLHRAVFRNGSVLSGLLLAEAFELPLQAGPTLSVRRHEIERLIFGPAAPGDKPQMVLQLRNDDEVMGTLADAELVVETPFGKVTAATAEMVELTAVEGPPGCVQIRMRSGTTISGHLVAPSLKFQIEPGPLLSVYAGHVVSISTGGEASGAAPKAGPAGSSARPTRVDGAPVPEAPAPMPGVMRVVPAGAARAEVMRRLEAAKAEAAKAEADAAAQAAAEAAAKAAHDKAVAEKMAAMDKEAAARMAAMKAEADRRAATTRPAPTTRPASGTRPPTTQPARPTVRLIPQE